MSLVHILRVGTVIHHHDLQSCLPDNDLLASVCALERALVMPMLIRPLDLTDNRVASFALLVRHRLAFLEIDRWADLVVAFALSTGRR